MKLWKKVNQLDGFMIYEFDRFPTHIHRFCKIHNHSHSELKRVHESGHDASHGGTHDTSSLRILDRSPSYVARLISFHKPIDFS